MTSDGGSDSDCNIHPFRPGQDDWNMYIECLGHLFVANRITGADKKCAILLSMIGDGIYKILSSLLAPDKPGEKSFDDLVTDLKNHFCPVPSEIIETFKFNSCFCKPGESIATYLFV